MLSYIHILHNLNSFCGGTGEEISTLRDPNFVDGIIRDFCRGSVCGAGGTRVIATSILT